MAFTFTCQAARREEIPLVRDSMQRADVNARLPEKVCSLEPDIVDASDLQHYKRLLLTKLEELSSSRGKAEAVVPGAGDRQGDRADQASSDTEAQLQIRLHQTDSRLLRAIEVALVRVKQGTYGVCVACGHLISKARLDAVPWTRHCRNCKEKQRT
jgi:DnaK suppressor protein